MSGEAPAPPPWKFISYKTADGAQVVQDWYWKQTQEVRDELNDLLDYLKMLPNHLWVRPGFDRLGDTDGLCEIRWKVHPSIYRIYGCFGIKRNEFTFLVGTDKKTSNQKAEKGLAQKRKKNIEAALKRDPTDRGLVHEFTNQRESNPAAPSWQGGAKGTNGIASS